MAEDTAVIDAPSGESSPEVRGPGFNSMVAQLDSAMKEVHTAPEPEPPLDTRPKDQTKKEAAKPEAKADTKVEAKPEAKKEEPEVFVSPKAADWKRMASERKEWEKKATEFETTAKTHAERLAALEKEYTEFKTKATIKPEEIEALRKERDEYSTKLERLALAETPRFKQYYEAKFEAAVAQAMDAVGKEKADQIKSVLEAPRTTWRKQQLNELVEAMESKVDQINLLDAVNRYDAARDERAKQLDDHKNGLRELKSVEAKQEQERAERDTAQRKAVMEQMLKKASETLDAFKPGEDAVHNALVEQNRQMVEKFVHGKLDPETLWSLPTWAAQGKYLQSVVAAKDAKITELTEALQKYQGAQPALEGGGETKPADANAGKSYTEQVTAHLRSMNQ